MLKDCNDDGDDGGEAYSFGAGMIRGGRLYEPKSCFDDSSDRGGPQMFARGLQWWN